MAEIRCIRHFRSGLWTSVDILTQAILVLQTFPELVEVSQIVANPVGLNDVARNAGVSVATASRALNGRPGVRAEIRDRVDLVAKALGYRPNRAAQGLVMGRSSILGLVVPTDQLQEDPYGSAVIHAVATATAAADYGLILHAVAAEPGQIVSRILSDGIVDGVLLSARALADEWVQRLVDAKLATVLIGQADTDKAIPAVNVEGRRSSAEAVTHLLDSGRRRIACIAGPPNRVDGADRVLGFRDAHKQAGCEIDETLIIAGDYTFQSGAEAAADLIDARPDAIFATNDRMALGAQREIQQRGLRIPDDIALVGFDGFIMSTEANPRLTTVAQPFEELGRTAVDLLLRVLNGEDVESVELTPQLVVRESSVSAGES